MAIHSLHRVQCIPSQPDIVWSFFANPANLPLITPPDMGFTILSPDSGDRIYPGQIIEYRLRPLPWMRTHWLTEITQVSPGQYFIDEQRHGPYSLWHHQHHFRKIEEGVEMTDWVHYAIPYGFIGGLANSLFVRKRVEEIFRYRRQRVEELFGVWQG